MEPLATALHGARKGVAKLTSVIYVFQLRHVHTSTPRCLVYVVQTVLKNFQFF